MMAEFKQPFLDHVLKVIVKLPCQSWTDLLLGFISVTGEVSSLLLNLFLGGIF